MKRHARIGQGFSTTKHILDIPKECIEPIRDIERTVPNPIPDDPEKFIKYVFSDGSGNISGDLADLINKRYHLKRNSAF